MLNEGCGKLQFLYKDVAVYFGNIRNIDVVTTDLPNRIFISALLSDSISSDP